MMVQKYLEQVINRWRFVVFAFVQSLSSAGALLGKIDEYAKRQHESIEVGVSKFIFLD